MIFPIPPPIAANTEKNKIEDNILPNPAELDVVTVNDSESGVFCMSIQSTGCGVKETTCYGETKKRATQPQSALSHSIRLIDLAGTLAMIAN